MLTAANTEWPPQSAIQSLCVLSADSQIACHFPSSFTERIRPAVCFYVSSYIKKKDRPQINDKKNYPRDRKNGARVRKICKPVVLFFAAAPC